MPMGSAGMGEMGSMEMPLPDNTLPMMTGFAQFGPIEMGGMFSVVKVREGLAPDDYKDPGWFKHPEGTVAYEWKGEDQATERAPSAPLVEGATEFRSSSPAGRRGMAVIDQCEQPLETDVTFRTTLAALAVIAISTAALAGGTGHTHDDDRAYGEPGDPKNPARVVNVTMREADGKMMFVPNRLEVRKGEQVSFMLRNNGEIDHEIVLATLEENLKHAAAMAEEPGHGARRPQRPPPPAEDCRRDGVEVHQGRRVRLLLPHPRASRSRHDRNDRGEVRGRSTMRKLVLAGALALISTLARAEGAPVDGTVTKIDTGQGKITMKHGPIKNLDMDAMTMVFAAADPGMLKGVKVGDKVRFEADRVNGRITITKISRR